MTNYGSGIWGGPGAQYISDANWALQTLDTGFVGDSITYRSAPRLRTRFGAVPGLTSFAIRAHAGQNMKGTNDWLDSLTYLPNRIFMAVGTNDVFDPYAVPAQIARTKAILGPDVELFWVDTYVGRPATQVDDIRNSGLVNAFIHEAIPADHIVSWHSEVTKLRGRARPLTYWFEDGVHPWMVAEDGHADACDSFAAVAVAPLL